MNILLDTHVFIWSTANPERLSQTVTNLLTDTSNTWILSIASVWEMQIKLQLDISGKHFHIVKITRNLTPLPPFPAREVGF